MTKETLSGVIQWFMIICATILLMMAIFGCSSVRRVLADPKKTDLVGREWERRGNGCVSNTTVEYLPGKEVTTFDTSYSTDIILTSDTFETNTAVIRWKDRIITQTIVRIDTLQVMKEDLRRLQLITGDLNREIGKSAQLEKDVAKERKRGNTAIYWAIGEGVLLLLFGFLLVKRK